MENDLPNYAQYSERLRTFNEKRWPSDSAVYIKDLAEAGFVYTGQIDLVFCFKCGIKESNWRDDENPMDRHAEANQFCPYLLKTKQLNNNDYISPLKSVEDFEREDLLYDWSEEKGVFQRKVALSTKEKKSEENQPLQLSHKNEEVQAEEPAINLRLAKEEMRYEIKRFQSFAFCPPSKHWPSAEKLARAGFYYVDKRNGMKCFCCDTEVLGWESSDQCPFTKHRSQSPTCDFIRGSFCGNIPIGQEDVCIDTPILNTVPIPSSTTKETSETPPTSILPSQSQSPSIHMFQKSNENAYPSHDYGHKVQEYDALPPHQSIPPNQFDRPPMAQNIPPMRPTQQFMNPPQVNFTNKIPGVNAVSNNDETQRLRSFFTWPREAKQTPMSLVKAGFLYTGKKDIVQCYACHLIVSDWHPNDQPIQVHQSRRPTCPFLTNTPNKQNHGKMRYFGGTSGGVNNVNQMHVPKMNGYNMQPPPKGMHHQYQLPVVKVLPMMNERQNLVEPQYLPHHPSIGAPPPGLGGVYHHGQPYHPMQSPHRPVTCVGSYPPPTGTSDLSNSMEKLKVSKSKQVAPSSKQSGYPQSADEIRKIHEINKERAREAYIRGEQENPQHQENERFCKICEVNPVCITFIPCGHLVVCESCALGLAECPFCRRTIEKAQRTYFYGN